MSRKFLKISSSRVKTVYRELTDGHMILVGVFAFQPTAVTSSLKLYITLEKLARKDSNEVLNLSFESARRKSMIDARYHVISRSTSSNVAGLEFDARFARFRHCNDAARGRVHSFV